MAQDWCIPLADLTASDLDMAGGKGANLGELVGAGFAVPVGFVVTTVAYREAVHDTTSPGSDPVLAATIPAQVRASILSHYAALGAGRVAVRSSATAEDLPGAAFAGQQDTFLGIVGEESLIDAVRRCWASLWTERAISYRARLGVDEASIAIAVVVQRMVPADIAGVMFTANPVTGVRDQVVIDSSTGLGEAVVSGLVTPDHAVLDASGAVLERRAGRGETVIRLRAEGGIESVAGVEAAPLTSAQLSTLAGVGRRITVHFGRPQDIEWAFVGDAISILQARPMTALPPAPRELSRRQYVLGPVILELLPRRPYPMEVSAWIDPNIGRHIETMVERLVGARFWLHDVIPAKDTVVQEYVPPNPVLTPKMLIRVLHTISGLGRDPRGWAKDPRRARFHAEAAKLDARDLRAMPWRELVDIPAQAGRLGDLITDLRVGYLPAAGAAVVRLRILLTALGRVDLFTTLILKADTSTHEANAALVEIAQLIRLSPALAGKARGLDGAMLHELVESDSDAGPVREALQAFLARFGHRETTSILLPCDPTWSAAPETVMSLIVVLLSGGDEHWSDPDPEAAARALKMVLRHPVIRATRSGARVRRLVRTAAAAVSAREDTHFEITRTMPVSCIPQIWLKASWLSHR